MEQFREQFQWASTECWTGEANRSISLWNFQGVCVREGKYQIINYKFKNSMKVRKVEYTLLFSIPSVVSGEGDGTPLQYSCLENPMGGGAWWAAVHGVEKSRTRLSDFTVTFHFHALEKEMATHPSVLARRIPGTREPGGLPSMGPHRVGHD